MSEDRFDEAGGASLSFLGYLPSIMKERWRWVAIPTVLLGAAGLVAALVLPPVYRSQSVLLVESPQLPEEVAGTGNTDVVDQRMERIRQEVLSRPELIEMIQRNGLYVDERGDKPLSEVIEMMRDATVIQPRSAEIQQSGRGSSSTIAFSLSFDYAEPGKAQRIAQELTERVLERDSTKNAEQAANVVQFLTEQSTDLQTQIAQLEGQISSIKASNGSALSNAGVTLLGSSSGSLDTQIALLQRENSQLNAQRELRGTAAQRDPVLAQAEAQLAAARAVYAESHPDVVIAKQRLEEAKQLASRNVEKLPTDVIDSQIAFNNSQIAALQQARSEESARVSAALNAQSRAPAIQEQVAQLQQRLDGLNAQYQRVAGQLLAAEANEKAENQFIGERLSIIDPPVVPDEPISPNRPLLIAGGFASGLGLGLLMIIALELFFRPVRAPSDIVAVTGVQPLVTIPVIQSIDQVKQPFLARLWPFRRRAAEHEMLEA